jgi:hypothetical protein
MKAVILLVIAFLGFPKEAYAYSANHMLQACELLEREVRFFESGVQIPQKPEAFLCWGFMNAIHQLGSMTESGKPILNACPDAKVSVIEAVGAFTTYARAHSTELDKDAALLAYRAMGAMYPCRSAGQ